MCALYMYDMRMVCVHGMCVWYVCVYGMCTYFMYVSIVCRVHGRSAPHPNIFQTNK